MTFNLVTKNLLDAVLDAEAWEKGEGSYYTDVLGVCMKSDKDRCFEDTTWNRRISDLRSAGATSADIDFWESSSIKHSKYRCILPRGHSGLCKFTASGLTDHAGLQLKINDAVNNPGANGIFMNRAGAICAYPVMDKTAADRIKSSDLKNLAVRLERAATGYQVATGLIDTIALASLIRGSENFLKLNGNKNHLFESNEYSFKDMIFKHRDFLKTFYKEKYQINITNESGFLCGPVLPETYKEITIDQFGSGTGTDDYDSIQFTHIYPVTSNKFMSRGLNVLFATKVENGLMLKYSLPEAKQLWKEASVDR